MLSLAIVDDCGISEAAAECLQASPYNVLAGVVCECDDGVLSLKGHLSSFYLKQRAQEAVAGISGVTQVVNDIKVDWEKQKERPMLVLSRKPNESICISDDIVVTVLSIRGDNVKLGIEAPREMPVHRREVHEAIQREAVPMTVG
jgi:carbon storage regulator